MTDINRTAIAVSNTAPKRLLPSPTLFVTNHHTRRFPYHTVLRESCQVNPLWLKVLVALKGANEASLLAYRLESLGCRVLLAGELKEATDRLQKWQPDLVVSEESFGSVQTDGGLRLAEHCTYMQDRINGWAGPRTVILVPVPDWNRVKRIQRTGAHIVVRPNNFDAVIRYVQTVAENLITDRILGPALVGIHMFSGERPAPNCGDCEWLGAEISYGSSKRDLRNLTTVRIVFLNSLLFRYRGQSPKQIEKACRESPFLKKLLGKHVLRESAIRMEATRLRKHFNDALRDLGISYDSRHFLPLLEHGASRYCLLGNRRLIHVPAQTDTGIKIRESLTTHP